MDEDLEAFDVEDWEQDIQDDIESIYPEEIIEDEFYPEKITREIFSPEALEDFDGENDEEQFFNYYPQDLERIELRLRDLGIKKLFKLRKISPSKMRKTSPSSSKNTRLQIGRAHV